jgi:hypothetical protein
MSGSGEIIDIDGACAECGNEFSARGTEKGLEAFGMRKIDGKWICNLCSGAGYGGMRRAPTPPKEGQP